MSFVEIINFSADFLTVVLSVAAIYGVIMAHKHGIFRALHKLGKEALGKKKK